MISAIVFAIAYMLKGGQFNIYAGRAFSTALVFAFCLQWGWICALKVTIAWIIGVYASMGEEAGGIGRLNAWWGEYKEKGFSRSYAIKKAFQRGCWMGSCIALSIENIYCIPIITFGFVFGHFIGQEIYYRIHKRDDWKYSEPIVGSFIGFCFYLKFENLF